MTKNERIKEKARVNTNCGKQVRISF